jgi:hypothetical protein
VRWTEDEKEEEDGGRWREREESTVGGERDERLESGRAL